MWERGVVEMPEWVVAMFMIGLVLVVRDMAKTVF